MRARHAPEPLRIRHQDVTAEEDIASVAGQLADLTRTVQEMAGQLTEVRERANRQQERTETQQERIDLAARELAEVSDRLQAAANALRESI
jgi:molecular chaperone GrpE (heat shock protein)